MAATTEREILRRIERETGVEGEDASADCDPDFRVEEGAAFACVDGQEVDYDVEVEEVHGDGRVDVHFDNVQAVLIVERLLVPWARPSRAPASCSPTAKGWERWCTPSRTTRVG